MRMLRVFDTLSLAAGGPVEGFRQQEAVLRRLGVETEVASLDRPDEDLSHMTMPVHKLGGGAGFASKAMGHTYRYSPALLPWLQANLGRFDAVVSHSIWTYSVLGAAQAVRGSGVPHFIFVHGMMDPWFRKQYPLKHIKKQAYWSLALGRAMHEANAILFTCEQERVLADGVFHGGGGYNGKAIAYGTADVPAETSAMHDAFQATVPVLDGRPYLLFLSRIHPKKGCDLLVDAFGQIAAARPDLQLVVAGPDKTGWRPELEAIAARNGVADRVHFPGMLKGDAKYGAFYGAEAFALPSHQENFGIAVAEALACRLPVLITPQVNIWREIDDAGAGIVGADDLPGTVGVLQAYCAMSLEERKAMGARGRELFLEKFEIERSACDLLDLARSFAAPQAVAA